MERSKKQNRCGRHKRMAHSAGRVHNERHLKKSLDEELSMTVKKYDDDDATPTLPYSIFIWGLVNKNRSSF